VVSNSSLLPEQQPKKLKVEAPKQNSSIEEEKKSGEQPPVLEAFKITNWDDV
jgi:hypothetical protein